MPSGISRCPLSYLSRAKPKIAPSLLSAIHCGIGRLDQYIRVIAVAWIDRDADADPYVNALLLAAELKRRSKSGNYFPGNGFGLPAPRNVGQDHGEFIAADTGYGVGFTYLATNSHGDSLQEFVAGGVPKGIVHRLELVQVEVQQRELARIAFGKTYRLI